VRRLLPVLNFTALRAWVVVLACAVPEPAPDESRSGGETTVDDATGNAFALSARNMSFDRRQRFAIGNSFFNKNWVTAPASTTSRDGLGPTFNARSCSTCHFKDGRGRPPGPGEEFQGLLLRLGDAGVYGDQLQPHAIADVPGEGTPRVTYALQPGAFVDGEPYSLRVPTYTIDAPAFGDLPDEFTISPRVAPVMIGMGLLAAIPEADILAAADPDDRDGDGISGRPNMVHDVASDTMVLGRLGWKANQPSVRQQVAGAFLGDMGITSSLFPGQNCPEGQPACRAAIAGGEPEVTDHILDDVVLYSGTLAVPARRGMDDPAVLRGKEIFLAAHCDGCHTPQHVTGPDAELPEVAHQTIFPYTDLLLHDMGDGLADDRPDFDATGNEWRTPPLWGLGLLHTVNGHQDLLHDGRARGPLEAVLWHGGEASAARDAVLALDRSDRDALVAFLNSL